MPAVVKNADAIDAPVNASRITENVIPFVGGVDEEERRGGRRSQRGGAGRDPQDQTELGDHERDEQEPLRDDRAHELLLARDEYGDAGGNQEPNEHPAVDGPEEACNSLVTQSPRACLWSEGFEFRPWPCSR